MHLTKEELNKNGLYRELTVVVIPANDRSEANILITAQRGNVQAVGLIVAGGSDADYAKVTFTLANNGLGFVQRDNLLAYAPSYRFKERVITPIELDENGILNYNFNNESATEITAIIELYYYNPFDVKMR